MDWEKAGLGILALFVTVIVVIGLYFIFREVRTFNKLVSRHNHVFQLVLSLLFFVGFSVAIYLSFGMSMLSSFLSGVGIALGLALQPIMKKMVAGIVFDTTVHAGAEIKCGTYEGQICSVGMVHTYIKMSDESKVCIHNDYFNQNPIVIKKPHANKVECEEPFLLKYW
tara:strand:- start:664 stop:1167 length:504 start_codon:yes stop_codon:yes gene_type:complete